MAKLNISRYHFISQHCTYELLSLVEISIEDEEENIWNIEDFLRENVSVFDILKILFVFEKSGGFIFKNNQPIAFAILLRDLDNIQYTSITDYWYNNEANGVLPIYNIGEIVVPVILPIFVATQQETGFWCIERLFRGEYRPLRNEIYSQKHIAKSRAEELNNQL